MAFPGFSELLEALLLVAALYLPGHFLGEILPGKGDSAAEMVLIRVACAVGVGVPVLTALALAGVFRTPVVVAVLSGVALGVYLWGRRSGSFRAERPGWDIRSLPYLLLVVGAFALYSIPAEYVVNSRDPGVYTVLARDLASTGALIHRDPLVGAVSGFHDFAGEMKYPGVFLTDGNLVVPQFFPGPFALLGLGSLVGGTWGVLYVVPVLGALSVGLAAALGRELFGGRAGLAGATLLAVSYTQVWWGRHPSSEVMTQFLVLGGLWMAVRFHRRGVAVEGVLAGLLLGGAMLLRVDAFLAALALPVVFLHELFTGRRDALRWLYPGVPLALFAAAALAYLGTFGSRYFDIIYSEHGLAGLLRLTPVLVVVAVGLAAVFFLARDRWGERVGRYLAVRGRDLAVAASVALVAVALWGYFVLPVPWESLPAASRDFDAYRTQILVRLVWFTTPAVALLGLVGFVMAARRTSGGIFVVLGAFLAFGVLYTVVPNVAPDLPWATRRFVPAAFPVLCLLAGFAASEVGRTVGRWSGPAGLAVSITLFSVALGWTVYLVLPILPFRELEGAVGQFDRVNAEIPSAEVVYMEMPDGYDVGASTFDYLYGRDVLPYDRLRFIREREDLEKAGLLDDAVYVTTDGGPAPDVTGLEFREVGGGRVDAPRLSPVQTRVPNETEGLEIRYRVFAVSLVEE